MSGKPLRRYALADVRLVINGYDIAGGSESDFISIERKEVGTYVVGADGEAVFNANTDFSAEVTVTLMPTSVAHQKMGEILAGQQEATGQGGSMPAVDFRLFDSNSGTFIQDRQCAVLEAPGVAFGKEASEVEWKLLLPNAFRPGNFAYSPDVE